MEHLKIVCIGGGTGLHAELSGLKEALPQANLAAVVTMMDSGKNSGKLRDEFGYLPPGDVRQCLVALADAPLELRQLMQYRFHTEKSSLDGHVIGNILLTALKDLSGGDEYAAIEAMERILNIKGRVYPVTLNNSHLLVKLADGTVIKGEGNLYGPERNNDVPITGITLEPAATLFEKTRDVLTDADFIIIGPGGIHHTIFPNLIVDGMRDALRDAKRRGARIILVTNTMTKYGDTNGFRASDLLAAVQEALGDVFIDAVIANNGAFPKERLAAYAEERAEPVVMDLVQKEGGPIIISEDMVNDEVFLKHGKPSFARHHPHKLAQAIEHTIIALGDTEPLHGKDIQLTE